MDLIDFSLAILVFLPHFVQFNAEVVALFVELRLLAKVELLCELGLVLALAQLLLEAQAGRARLELLFVFFLKSRAEALVLLDLLDQACAQARLLVPLLAHMLHELAYLVLIGKFRVLRLLNGLLKLVAELLERDRGQRR